MTAANPRPYGDAAAAIATSEIMFEPVRTRAQLREFVTLPRRLYAGMPGYGAPLDHERMQLLDPRKSPFFAHGCAAYWIARRQGVAVGRVSAQIDLLNRNTQPPGLGLFGCLDAIDSRDVVIGLMDVVERWLRARGCRLARGPFLLSINAEAGMLIEGHSEPPMILLGWHPAYLEGHLLAAGYARATRLLCLEATFEDTPGQALVDIGRGHEHRDMTVRNMNLQNLAADAEIGRRLFNDAWHGNWGFTPVAEIDIQRSIAEIKPFLSADSGFFVDVNGEPAAFALTVPNICDVTSGIGGAPGIVDWAKLGWKMWRKRWQSHRLTLFGVASKFHDSFLGARIADTALREWRRRMRACGTRRVLAGWLLETNQRSIRPLLAIGLRNTRTYGIYEKSLVN